MAHETTPTSAPRHMDDVYAGEKYVVGVDGSSGSDAAVRWALGRGAEDGRAVELVHAYKVEALPSTAGPLRTTAMCRTAAEHAELLMGAVAARTSTPNAVERVVVEGDPATVLLRHSGRAGMLILGAHPQHRLTPSRVGRVAARCLHEGSCPVLIVPGAGMSVEHTGADVAASR